MSPITIGILAVSMSMDAFLAAIGKGAQAKKPTLSQALRIGAIFGTVEAITPLIGWALGMAASQYIEAVDHWIAFILLSGVGIHMLLQSLAEQEENASGPGLWAMVATAIGTSIDAMAVGVSLAFLEVNILVIALAIGLATAVMSSTGILAGRYLGMRFGKAAGVVGGIALIGIGALILYEHLSAG